MAGLSLTDRFGVVILILAEVALIFRRPVLIGYLKSVWLFSLIAVFGSSFYLAWLQYQAWASSGSFGKFLLPPYQKIYFFYYVGWRIFTPWLVALAAAIIISQLAGFLNKRFGEKFLEPEEIKLLALGIFLTGWPGLLFFIAVALFSGLLWSITYHFLGKGRAPLFYLWLPAAIFAILIESMLPSEILNVFIL